MSSEDSSSQRRPQKLEKIVAGLSFLVLLPLFYFVTDAKTVHSNTGVTDRGYDIIFDYDQHPYLWAARKYRETDYGYMMPRHRMPGYALLISPLFDPETAYVKNPDLDVDHREVSEGFFERAKLFNIFATMLMLVALYFVSRRLMPIPESLIVTWGYAWLVGIFRAPYVQPESLFYVLFLFSLVLLWQQLRSSTWLRSVLAAVVLAACFILKSTVLPLIALFVACVFVKVGWSILVQHLNRKGQGSHPIDWKNSALDLGRAILVPVLFLIFLSPYLLNTWKNYGNPLWDVHSQHYMWMDTKEEKLRWRRAGIALPKYLTPLGEEGPPTAEKYLREHSLDEIIKRPVDGFSSLRKVLREEYPGPYYLVKNVMPVLLVFSLVLFRRKWFAALRDHWPELLLVAGFFIGYGLLYSWYQAIGLGPRLLLALILPLFFVEVYLVSRWSRPIPIPWTSRTIEFRTIANATVLTCILWFGAVALTGDYWEIEGGK